jgi:hypothetical protein
VPCGSARPGTTKGQRPPVAGRTLAGAFGPRLAKGQRVSAAGAMAPARMCRAEEFPAFRSGSPCARHLFSTLLKGKTDRLKQQSAHWAAKQRGAGALPDAVTTKWI